MRRQGQNIRKVVFSGHWALGIGHGALGMGHWALGNSLILNFEF